jgi:hypothetical protein
MNPFTNLNPVYSHTYYVTMLLQRLSSRMMRTSGHIARILEMRTAFNVFVHKPQEKKPHGIRKLGCKNQLSKLAVCYATESLFRFNVVGSILATALPRSHITRVLVICAPLLVSDCRSHVQLVDPRDLLQSGSLRSCKEHAHCNHYKNCYRLRFNSDIKVMTVALTQTETLQSVPDNSGQTT